MWRALMWMISLGWVVAATLGFLVEQGAVASPPWLIAAASVRDDFWRVVTDNPMAERMPWLIFGTLACIAIAFLCEFMHENRRA